jgi:hypothetical protein
VITPAACRFLARRGQFEDEGDEQGLGGEEDEVTYRPSGPSPYEPVGDVDGAEGQDEDRGEDE